jgi:hypothetical protein
LEERIFGLDSLKSILNRDMEEKRIVLRELSCRTAAELPPPDSGSTIPSPPCLLLRTAAEA